MRDMLPIPTEVEILGTYYPPILLTLILAAAAMVLTTWLLNRRRLFRYVFFPNLVMLAVVAIYTVIIGTFVIPS
ncbi:MAG: DUF1656 domain-containing protein [Alphaproteobacteria bacterium]|nr:DUF1656 domain-containing protein [Alphaproteobacteria bacterium]